MTVESILCIPGNWKNPEEVVQSVALLSKEYIFAGFILSSITTPDTYFKMQIHGHDPQLASAFAIASEYARSEDNFTSELQTKILNHQTVIYLIGSGGSTDEMHKLIRAGIALLDAGGLAVKVETAGIAYTPDKWQSFLNADKRTLFDAFVAFVYENGDFYSVGMHNFGSRDGIIPNTSNPNEAHYTLGNFLLYGLIENPVFKSGHTFSLSANAPYYRLNEIPCLTNSPESPFYNPFGMWELRKI